MKLPKIPSYLVDILTRWLMDREGMLRPPEATAKFLVLCALLRRTDQPFPPRAEAAAHLGCSVALIDRALSQRLATGDIEKIHMSAVEGNVRRRLSTVRQRRVVPSAEIIQLVEENRR